MNKGFRPMEEKDAPQVHRLLEKQLSKCDVHQVFSAEESQHYLMPVKDAVCSYVVEVLITSITTILIMAGRGDKGNHGIH